MSKNRQYEDQLRAILPLAAVLQVMDILVSHLLTSFVNRAFPSVGDTFNGARPHTQTLDIAHGLQSVVEKIDIQRYYDSLDTVLLCKWLEAQGVRSQAIMCRGSSTSTTSTGILKHW